MPHTLGAMRAGRPVWTVGHSTHGLEDFLVILKQAGVEAVADIRSQPYSRYNAHFNREPLRSSLVSAGFQYAFLGEELGGRPRAAELYDDEGHVLYGNVAETPVFKKGIERLMEGRETYRVAVLCSEEDPTHCHRRLLVGRVLHDSGVDVFHVRGDGNMVAETALRAAELETANPPLFGQEDRPWRSTRSVSRSTQPSTSSKT